MCRIIADDDVARAFPEPWNSQARMLPSLSETVTIRLEKTAFTDDGGIQDGWVSGKKRDPWQAAYFQGGRALFAIASKSTEEVKVSVGNMTEHRIRLGIQYGLMAALYQRCVGLHGVTLRCGNEIVICSAPSGTGKTTLAKLLEKHCDAVAVNGDFALLCPTEEGVIFEPTPFCGTSGRSLNHRFRVNRVVFLGQAKENRWRILNVREAMVRFMSNAFVPTWDSGMRQAVQENILKCISMMKTNAFDFTPTQEAAEVFLKKVQEDPSFRQNRHSETEKPA